MKSPEPFIKCVGGKRSLLPEILRHLTGSYTSYCEPFLGGGAVFFGLSETQRVHNGGHFVLADADDDLIFLYQAVQDDLPKLIRDYARITTAAEGDLEAAYYRERDLWNKGRRSAARHLFLRYHGFNGLWRTDQNGRMNASWNKGKLRQLDVARLESASAALQRAALLGQDFRHISSWVEPDGLVYLDPPYLDTWTDYHASRWTERDLIELLQLAQVWTRKGAHVALSHTDSERVRMLLLRYWPEAVVHVVYAHHRVSRNPASRGEVREILART